MSIGEKILELRSKHELSQKDLANVVGVSDKTVSSWETNRATPRMGAIQKIADYFHIKKSDIIEPNTDEEKKLIEGYRSLDDSKRQVLNCLIEFLNSPQGSGVGIVGLVQKNSDGSNFFSINGNQYSNSAK